MGIHRLEDRRNVYKCHVEKIHNKDLRMGIKFYYMPQSPACRGPMLTAKAIDLDLEMEVCNLFEGDHMKEEFLQMNPCHTIPTIDDDGFHLCESRAIQVYFVEKYSKESDLYPECVMHRALVNQRLYFDAGTLQRRLMGIIVPVVFKGATELEEGSKEK